MDKSEILPKLASSYGRKNGVFESACFALALMGIAVLLNYELFIRE
ncbi:hypothetical protein [Vibrio brasiliensis]|nr:hypothetical protein [Vibrio brasiliensis]MCG9727496.1 hypothetical protein [Vibrio brasiliensis]